MRGCMLWSGSRASGERARIGRGHGFTSGVVRDWVCRGFGVQGTIYFPPFQPAEFQGQNLARRRQNRRDMCGSSRSTTAPRSGPFGWVPIGTRRSGDYVTSAPLRSRRGDINPTSHLSGLLGWRHPEHTNTSAALPQSGPPSVPGGAAMSGLFSGSRSCSPSTMTQVDAAGVSVPERARLALDMQHFFDSTHPTERCEIAN